MRINENLDSLTSYSVGGAGILASVTEWTGTGTAVLAFFIVAVRLCYDAVRLYRYLKTDSDKTDSELDKGSDKK